MVGGTDKGSHTGLARDKENRPRAEGAERLLVNKTAAWRLLQRPVQATPHWASEISAGIERQTPEK